MTRCAVRALYIRAQLFAEVSRDVFFFFSAGEIQCTKLALFFAGASATGCRRRPASGSERGSAAIPRSL